ncbi:MAG: RNA polymerase sigma factor [Gammaproteobacteria bacterium]|nr:RNA polymerase sigma factor [Gammaproteobacteria bacterium]
MKRVSSNSDELLQVFLRQRSESSFRKLYRCHTPALFAMAMRLCGTTTSAEELTQDTWCRAVERIKRFERKSRFRTWLVGILINCYRESVRDAVRMPQASESELAHLSVAAITPLRKPDDQQADVLDVERALSALPPGYKEVVLLHDLGGYTHREIAAMLDISDGTSKSQLKRGRERLRTFLVNRSADSAGTRGLS